jgi:predicted ATPase/DNA-binding SARP family transcriptional activator
VEFRVLGALEVHSRGQVHRPGSAKQRRLLTALLIEPRKVVTTERLVELLWGDDPPPSARNSLQTYVARVRGALRRWGSSAGVTTHAAGYALDVEPDQVDSVRFERLLTFARAGTDAAQKVAVLDEALGLWRGPAFVDLASTDAGRGVSLRLEELWLAAAQIRVDALLELGRYAEAVADLEAAVAAQPLQERPHEQLVRALAASGRTAEALERARAYRRRLADEVGLDPSPRLAAVEQDVRRQAPAVAPAAPQPAPSVAPAHRAPRYATSLVGRDDDLARVNAALEQARLVTVTGPGGVGKTRLALAVADARSSGAAQESRLCELGPVGDGAAVAHAIAGAVGVTAAPGRSLDVEAVVESLHERELLLVLDCCEHLLDSVAAFADAVLRRCPRVVLLATSRERLGVDGEHVLPLAPLPVEAATAGAVADAGPADAPAVRLFADRARAVWPTFELSADNVDAVVEVCRRLDGLPLAIELAAARANALEPADLAARLDEGFTLMEAGRRAGEPRHRTLRATVDWSYQLLDETERRVFSRLSVFAGGFTLPLAEQVTAGAGAPQERIAAVVAGLVDKSMLVPVRDGQPSRYTMLETLRAYGWEQLIERGEADATARTHASAMVAFAEQAASMLRTSAEADWVVQLDAEVDNLRAAHRWALRTGEGDLALRASRALHRYGGFRPHREVLGWAEAAVALPGVTGHPALPGALAAAGVAAWMRGDLDAAEAYAQRGLDAAGGDDPAARAVLCEVTADVAAFRGHVDEAAGRFAEAARLAEQAGDAQTTVFTVGSHALVRAYGGHARRAAALAAACRDRAHRLRNPSGLAWARYVCGEVVGSDDPPRALILLAEGRQIADSVRNGFVAGVAEVSAASVRSRLGDPAEPLPEFAALIDRWRRSNNWTQQWVTVRNLVESLVRLGEDEVATVLHAAATAGADPPSYGEEAARLRAAAESARGRLDPAVHRAAVERGRGLTPDEVLILATGTIERLLAERDRSTPAPG